MLDRSVGLYESLKTPDWQLTSPQTGHDISSRLHVAESIVRSTKQWSPSTRGILLGPSALWWSMWCNISWGIDGYIIPPRSSLGSLSLKGWSFIRWSSTYILYGSDNRLCGGTGKGVTRQQDDAIIVAYKPSMCFHQRVGWIKVVTTHRSIYFAIIYENAELVGK